jgi:hypothetical protein
MLRGQEIKNYLLENLKKDQLGKSSHWEYHLQDFSFDEEKGLKNITGFGGIVQRSLRERLYHFTMQLPDRKKGRKFPGFNKLISLAQDVAKIQNRTLDSDMMRHVLSLSCIESMIPNFNIDDSIDLVIGDGFGVLSSLINRYTGNKVASVNLNEVLLVDYLYTRGIIADEGTVLAMTESDIEEAINNKKIQLVYIQADNHSLIRNLPIRVAYNLASMQEMNPSIIGQYFEDLRNCRSKTLYFYCDNRVEKVLIDGTIVRFQEYPWSNNDEILIDELCPWHQHFYISNPLHRRFYSTRLPFYRKFDGPHQHRLAKFSNL